MLDVFYYIVSFLTALGLPLFALAVVAVFIRPSILNKRLGKAYTRKRIATVGIASFMVALISFGTVLAATEPESIKQARLSQEAADAKVLQQKQQEEAKRQTDLVKPVVKTETKKETIAFESTEQESATLTQGQKQVATQGVNGERTITYEVTYVQGKETARKEIKNEITTQPVTQVTLVGTYVAPPTAPATVPQTTTAPTTQSSGARTGAICNDGSSSTATGKGACSHHGGVSYWLYG